MQITKVVKHNAKLSEFVCNTRQQRVPGIRQRLLRNQGTFSGPARSLSTSEANLKKRPIIFANAGSKRYWMIRE
jgi:hypothetical protein